MKWDVALSELDAALARVRLAEGCIPEHEKTAPIKEFLRAIQTDISHAGEGIFKLVETHRGSAWTESNWLGETAVDPDPPEHEKGES